MTRWQLFALLGAAFLLGVLAVTSAPRVPAAAAQDDPAQTSATEGASEATEDPAELPDAPDPEPIIVSSEGGRLVCRLFLIDLRSADTLDTSDRTTEVGQWVGEQVDAGMMLHGVDFEVGQKPTGYPQGYMNVCVYPG